jgi:hypothetical protein
MQTTQSYLLFENYLIISFLIVVFWAIIKKKPLSTIIVMAIFSPIISIFIVGVYAGAVFAEHQ